MPTSDEIARDPEWIPHAIDLQRRAVEFLHIPSSQLPQSGFLFEFQPDRPHDRAWLPFDDVVSMEPATAPLHFIFHSAFCRSTLLTRALNIPGLSNGLNEPGIFAALTNAGDAARPLMRPLLRLLARPHGDQRIVFAKPTNHANRLIPALMDAVPDAKAILMTNDLSGFLAGVHRRGLLGRRWARELYLEMQSYAGVDFQMSPRESFAMTDMQAAGLAWLLNQNLFRQLSTSVVGRRLRVLHGDRFNKERAKTLQAAIEFVGFRISDEQAAEAAEGSAFATHSKLGGTYTDEADGSGDREKDDVHAQETAQVNQWLAIIANQLSLELPAGQTLF